MKNIHLIGFILLALFCQNTLQAQNKKKITIHRTWIALNDKSFEFEGVLYDIQDASILVSNSENIKDYYDHKFEFENIAVKRIKSINVRKTNRVWVFTLVGTAVGASLGSLFGYISGDDTPSGPFDIFVLTAEEKAVGGGIVGGLLGAGVGTLIGLTKITIPINGNQNLYKANKAELQKYTIKKDL